MILRPSWSIRHRILVPFLALLGLTAGATGLAVAHWAAVAAERHYLERGRSIGETLQRSSFPLTEPVLRQLKGLGGAEFLLIDADGRVSAGTLDGLNGRPGPFAAGPTPGLDFGRAWTHEGVAYRVGGIDRAAPEPRRLRILLPERALDAEVGEARRTVLVVTAIGVVLAAAVASWVGRNLSQPLSAILGAIRRIGQGERHPERLGLPLGREDEIGELARVVAQAVDRLRVLEAEREETERLRLIRQVSSGLAHEIRNPLTAATMTLQLYISRNKDRDPEPLRIALEELGRVERQVSRFLKLARPDPPRLRPTALAEIVDRAVLGLRATAEHRRIELLAGIDPGLPAVLADDEQLGQVLANLLGNALDAAGPGGTVRALGVARGDTVVLDVEDNGPGVPAESAPGLFRPFFTTKPEGVGLGLALCDTIVRDHGGSIVYDRREGWTRFRVVLPSAPGVLEPAGVGVGGGEIGRWPM